MVARGAYMPAAAVEVSLCSETGARERSSGLQKFESHREASLKCAGFERDPKGLSKFLLEFEVESVR